MSTTKNDEITQAEIEQEIARLVASGDVEAGALGYDGKPMYRLTPKGAAAARARVLAGPDPMATIKFIADLVATLPQVSCGARLSLGMSDEAMALLRSLGGEIDRDLAMSGGLPVVREWALLRVGDLEVQAVGEQRAATAADLEPGGPWSPARATDRGQAGIAVGATMAGVGLLASLAVLFIMAGPAYGTALLVFALCCGKVLGAPAARRPPARTFAPAPAPRDAGGGGRVRRPMVSAVQPHRHTAERGSVRAAALALLAGGAIMALLAVAALTWGGR